MDGCSVAKKEKLLEEGCDLNQIGTAIVNNFIHQILDVGTFHADPHQGNIMVSHGIPYWIDFGMIGRITNKEIDQIQSIVLSLIDGDTDGMINVMMSMGATSAKTDRDKLTMDVDAFLSRFTGMNSLNDIDLSSVLGDVMDLASKHHIQMPGTFTMLVRAILAIEGVLEQLCPELNLLELVTSKFIDRVKKNFDLKQTLLDAGKGILGIGKKAVELPGLAAEALSGLSKGRMKINMELTGIDEPLEKIGAFAKNIVLAIISCVLFIGSCLLWNVDFEPKTPTGAPLLAVIIMVFSVSLGIYAVNKMTKKE